MIVVIHGDCLPTNRRVYRKVVTGETYNNHHSVTKLALEFSDGSLVVCATFPAKPGEGSVRGCNGDDVTCSARTKCHEQINVDCYVVRRDCGLGIIF